MHVATEEDKKLEAISITVFFFKNERSVLMFLPGKGEIAEMKTGLCSAGVPVQQMEAIHGDMAPEEVR